MFRLLYWLWRLPEKLDSASTVRANTLSVSADKLLVCFFANQIAADQEYRNRVVQFNSTVHTIKRELGVNVLYCQTERGLLRCECVANANRILGGLSKGQEVQVIGVVKGVFVGNVVISGCRVQLASSDSH